MTHRAATIIGLVMIFLSGYILFTMKREVETLNFALSEIQKQVTIEKGNINLLKAEYVYLTSPARLSKLSAKYLNLSSTSPDQMIPDPTSQLATSIASIGTEQVGKKRESVVASSSKPVRWRYKKINDKYIHKASLSKKE